MKFIQKFIQKIIQQIMKKEQPKQLGRWNLEYCNTKLNNKIDLSNEDHCGSCGEYAIIKTKILNDTNKEIKS